MKEDETIINCSDWNTPGKWHIYSTQRKVVTKLRKNPIFEKTKDVRFKEKVIGVEGFLPYKAITFRKTLERSLAQKQHNSRGFSSK